MATPKFIDYTDFTGKLSLAIDSENTNLFNTFAAQSEYDVLIYLLNSKLYNDLKQLEISIQNVPLSNKSSGQNNTLVCAGCHKLPNECDCLLKFCR